MLDACRDPGPGHRDHPAAGAPARRGRRDPLLRHRGAAGRDRRRHRHRARRRPGGRATRSATAADLDALRAARRRTTCRTSTEAVRALVAELGATPLIGFAGAPFTLASYLIEGGPSRDHARTKALMHGDAGAVARRCSTGWPTSPRPSCRCRSSAGAQRGAAVRLLGRRAVARPTTSSYVLPHSRDGARPRRPTSACRASTSASAPASCSPLMRAAGADVVGVDWRVPLDEAARRLGAGAVVQGNLDPALLLAPWPVIEAAVRRIVAEGRGRRRAHLQPRPRRAAGHRPGRARPASSSSSTRS